MAKCSKKPKAGLGSLDRPIIFLLAKTFKDMLRFSNRHWKIGYATSSTAV